MSVRTEIETYRQQIEIARTEEEYRIRIEYPKIPELPKGVFNKLQLERWQKAEPTISVAAEELLADLGIVNFKLETDFSQTNKNSKHIDFALKFREDKVKEDWEENTPYQVAIFWYDPGGKFTLEQVGAYYVHLAVPKKKKNTNWFYVEEAMQWIDNPEANIYHFAGVSSTNVCKEHVQNLLKLLLSNPATVVNPEPKKVTVGR